LVGGPQDPAAIAAGETPLELTITGGSPGAAAGNDDQAPRNPVATEVDTIFNLGKIIPQPNVLDQYASYTYSASFYLMSPQSYRQMVASKKKTLTGAELLFQSGGAPVRGRNPYFTDDYYIDQITMESVMLYRGTRAAHNVNGIKMRVVEPNGITLINNLAQAVQGFVGGGPSQRRRSYGQQLYLLVIRFYGYDKDGNLMRGGIKGMTNPLLQTSTIQDNATDRNSIVEKFYPVTIKNISFKIANKVVEYEIDAIGTPYFFPTGTMKGVVPYNVELSGQTLKDALTGTPNIVATTAGSTTSRPAVTNSPESPGDADQQAATTQVATNAPPTADAAPSTKKTIRTGLMTALNQFQQNLVESKIVTYADQYEVEFVTPQLENARLRKPGTGTDISRTGPATSNTVAGQLNPATQSVDFNSRIVTIVAGQPITQVLELMARNSTYINAQQLYQIDDNTGAQVPNPRPANNVAWFKISVESVPISPWDPKRNDYAYKIKYILSPYKVANFVSPWFPSPQFQGVHKQYNYWFTGENTSVLNFEQEFNHLYNFVMSGLPFRGTSNANDLNRTSFQPRSEQTDQGANTRVNEPAANGADYLYSPGDQGRVRLTIVGDPAWLQQGEAFAGQFKDRWNFSAFLADGTINMDSQDILFEILFNMPRDYDLNTGLINVGSAEVLANPATGQRETSVLLSEDAAGNINRTVPAKKTKQSYVYRCNKVTSEFRQGKFTQTLEGSIMTFFGNPASTANNASAQELQQQATAGNAQRTPNYSIPEGAIAARAYDAADPFSAASIAAQQAQSSQFYQNLLGSVPTRSVPPPAPPTSSGDIVSVPPSNATEPNNVVNNNAQQIAPSDDFLG
jgi:hypothetical protein